MSEGPFCAACLDWPHETTNHACDMPKTIASLRAALAAAEREREKWWHEHDLALNEIRAQEARADHAEAQRDALLARVEEYQRTCDSLREIARGAEADRDAALAERDRASDWSGNLEAERDRVFELLAEAGLWDRSRGGLAIGVQGVVDAVAALREACEAALDEDCGLACAPQLRTALAAARALAGAKGEGGA